MNQQFIVDPQTVLNNCPLYVSLAPMVLKLPDLDAKGIETLYEEIKSLVKEENIDILSEMYKLIRVFAFLSKMEQSLDLIAIPTKFSFDLAKFPQILLKLLRIFVNQIKANNKPSVELVF